MHDRNDKVNALLQGERIPPMATVRQKFESGHIENPGEVLRGLLERPELKRTIRPGMSVAVTAGSRGIDHIDELLRETVGFIQAQGGKPFIVPAMGSHGGAVAKGQIEILEGFHITEETMGCPIKASMEVEIGRAHV